MQFPNKFRTIWWGMLVGLLTYLMTQRFHSFISGAPNTTDILVFVIWIALLVAPLFHEVAFFGVKWKREIDNLRTEFSDQIFHLRSDIQNTINIYPPLPPSDSEISKLEEQVKPILEKTLREKGIPIAVSQLEERLAPDTSKHLFSVRYAIENELRRITNYDSQLYIKKTWPNPSIRQMLETLIDTKKIDKYIYDTTREVTSICSASIHGKDISDKAMNFVREVTPGLIATLRDLAPIDWPKM